MAEIKLQKRAVYAGDVHIALLKAGWGIKEAVDFVKSLPEANVAPVHCKDCRYGEPVEDGLFLCHYSGMEWNGAEHFCSYGERRC